MKKINTLTTWSNEELLDCIKGLLNELIKRNNVSIIPPNRKEFYTRKETAEIFGVKHRTLWKWEKRGVIKPDLYINKRPRYSLKTIEALKSNTCKEKAGLP